MKLKRAAAALMAACMLFALVGCGNDNTTKEPFTDMAQPARQYAEQSLALHQAVQKNYWLDEVQFAYHYYPNQMDDDHTKADTAFAWPYTEMVASTWRIATLDDTAKENVASFYRSTLVGFEYYRSQNSKFQCYVASRAVEVGQAGGDTYYDDNVWISREFLNAHEIFGDQAYLVSALGVAEYVWSGWANDELGGIFWCEQKRDSRNTCSNAPAALLFARLYQATGDSKWLDRAKKVYAWTYKTLRDPSDNVYWDNISNEGNITKWKFTYNTGSMIGAGVKLHEITGEELYLTQAKASALGAYNYWFPKKEGDAYRQITSDNPWFNVLLLDAWTELYPYDREGTLPYIQAYEANLNHAYGLRDEKSGFMPSNWVKGFDKEEDGTLKVYGLNILDMAANAENFGTLAHFYDTMKGESDA